MRGALGTAAAGALNTFILGAFMLGILILGARVPEPRARDELPDTPFANFKLLVTPDCFRLLSS